jgi:hypothetical protein
MSQENKPVEHLTTAPLNGARGGVALSAPSIERGAGDPTVIHLRGNVEIKGNGFIVRADKADYDETTGEVDALGNVKVKPCPPLTEAPSADSK